MAVAPDGSVYVVDEYNFRVQKFTPDGRLLRVWGAKGKVNVVLSALNFFIPEGRNSTFYYPARIAAGPDSQVYVADSYNNRVQVFTPDGGFVRKWGGLGVWSGRFRVSSGIALDPAGRVYVADFYNDRIQIFSQDGEYLGKWGTYGNGPGQFDGPTGLTISRAGDIYVVDFHNNRIQRFHN